MIFHLPFLIAIILFVMQSHYGLKHFLRESLLIAVIYTIILFGYFANHDLVVVLYMFLLMFWSVVISTYFQRNSWRKYMTKEDLDYD
ncbi:hypothetical protein MKY84_12920 [Chryseomicrobium sp. FSL W7-1435]|uniref:hypothetical protein n=1 Tax=Chryseomicrobium sp. FSL W7-1435 TaxID=2921704 RepID=UPI00315B0A93